MFDFKSFGMLWGTVLAHLTTDDITFETLNSNSDVGTGADQVAAGNHTHTYLEDKADVEGVLTGEISSHTHADSSFSMNLLQLTQGTAQLHDSTADLEIEWLTQDETDSNFSHSTSTNPEQITCETAGWLDVRYAVQYDQDDTARLNTTAYITVNGTLVDHTTGNRTYYRGLAYGKWGTAQGSFYLEVAEDDVLVLHSGVADGNTDFTLSRAIDTVPDITFIQLRYLGA